MLCPSYSLDGAEIAIHMRHIVGGYIVSDSGSGFDLRIHSLIVFTNKAKNKCFMAMAKVQFHTNHVPAFLPLEKYPRYQRSILVQDCFIF